MLHCQGPVKIHFDCEETGRRNCNGGRFELELEPWSQK